MKYFVTQKIWKASNVTFATQPIKATSYDWWTFVREINGRVVFNGFRYSVTTAGHQAKVRRLMTQLNIRVDFEVETCKSLDTDWVKDAIELQELRIDDLKAAINKPRSQAAKNVERRAQIALHRAKIDELKTFFAVRDNVVQLRGRA